MAAEISSYGIKFYVSKTKNTTYTEYADVIEGALPEVTKDTYDAKTLTQSTRAKEHRGTYFDGGEIAYKLVFDKAVYADILGFVKDPDAYPVRIVLPDHATELSRSKVEFSGLFTRVGTPLEADGKRLECDVSVKVTGNVTFTPSA